MGKGLRKQNMSLPCQAPETEGWALLIRTGEWGEPQDRYQLEEFGRTRLEWAFLDIYKWPEISVITQVIIKRAIQHGLVEGCD